MLSKLVASSLAEPMRIARVAFDALFRPSRVAPLIRFDDEASAKSAALFWFSITAAMVFLHGFIASAMGVETGIGDTDGNPWLQFLDRAHKLLEKYQIFAYLISAVLLILFSAIWYGAIRLFVSGKKLPFLGFLQCVAYPAAAIGILALGQTFAMFFIAGDFYSKDFDAAALLARRPELMKEPTVAEACVNTRSFLCKSSLIAAMNPQLIQGITIYSWLLYGWTWLNTATIIKATSGTSRRVSLGALLLVMVAATLAFMGYIFWLVSRM